VEDRTVTLQRMVEHKRQTLAAAKAKLPLGDLELMVAQEEPPRNLFQAVTRRRGFHATSVIAQVMRRSPGSGLLRPEYEGDRYDPADIARRYHEAGAAAIACVTEEGFHDGHLDHLRRIKDAVHLPVMRWDVILDPWQLWESRAAGADAVLLIADILREGELVDMLILAQQLQLTTMLEVHDVETLLKVRPHYGFPHRSYALLAIDNRDPVTMREDLKTTLRLADLVEDRATLVSEAAVRDRDDLLKLRGVGVRIVMVGEHLLRNDDPGFALRQLMGSD
jgi:indole-3-glycerol phosphate synthase